MQITFIRHAETAGNVAGVWQGHGDSPLTEWGREQARLLGSRPGLRAFDRVVSSDLGRVRETARLAGLDPEPDPAWREIALGDWEGLTSAEIAERFPEQLEALRAGRDIELLGGESTTELGARVDAAIAAIREQSDDGDHVAVVTHGGIIATVVARHLDLPGRPRPRAIGRLANTSLTTLEFGDDPTMLVFNDATHTGRHLEPGDGATMVALVRHGETEANVEGRWQGITDGPLTEQGRLQAARLAAAFDGLDHVYSSHLQRAADTAAALAGSSGVGVTVRHDLYELHFGEWEDLTPAEMRERWPDEWAAIYVHDRDEPRGITGETAEALGMRISAAVAEIGAAHRGARVAAVTHGGAIRAYAADVVGLSFDNRSHLALPGNTEVTQVIVGEDGPVLASYNSRPGR